MFEPTDSDHALAPVNDSERLLFQELFSTPIHLDCHGRPRPGFVASWSRDSTGREWTLTLKEGIRHPDGLPVDAYLVVEIWRAHQPFEQSLEVDRVLELGDRILLRLRQPSESLPRALADPAYALLIQSDRHPALHFDSLAARDPRDAIDRGAGLAVTRDPGLVDYASSRPGYSTYPLPWSRTYVLVQGPNAGSAIESPVDSVRRTLARDAVRADAREAEPPFWWENRATCATRPAHRPRASSSRVVYVRGDDVARGLAARLVALDRSGRLLSTAGLEPWDFATALRDGSEQGYILALPKQTLAPCRDSSVWPVGSSIHPLIDTRAYAIVHREAPPLAIEWDGTVRVVEP